ncbi:BTAD domain-containing putative transcriptional regulator [Actinoplanes sp. NPDC051851]|uniref:AfsR/SARP family transcriptional regulator n=1 Tax=Actinoplanes sp. NPDC051851 TaxID=3154753 RepID=UPI0034140DAE
MTLRFEMLGRLRAYRGSEPIDIGPLRQQAVLALLLLHPGEAVPVATIVEVLWDGDPPENGVDIVQRYVGGLRRALDPSMIAFTPQGYVLRGGDVDVAEFRSALARAHDAHRTGDLAGATDVIRDALRLWQDEPLTGLTGPVFESARARLAEEHATASALLAKPILATPPPAPSPPADRSPDYAEPVDPWAGHDLFPPGPF